jgi:hypothetical protein
MRVCELHGERAKDTLFSRKTGTEYDLCPQCLELLESILGGEIINPPRMMSHPDSKCRDYGYSGPERTEKKPKDVIRRRRTRKIASAPSQEGTGSVPAPPWTD